MQIERTERTNANGREGSLLVMPEKEVNDFGQRFRWSGRWYADALANVIRARADRADDLASARFYCAEEHVSECWVGATRRSFGIEDNL